MKKVILILLVLATTIPTSIVFSQKKEKAGLVSIKESLEDGQWLQWYNWEKTKTTIVHDTTKNQFIVKNDSVQVYTIVKKLENRQDEIGDDIQEWVCVSENNTPCTIKMVVLHTFNKEKQFYIEFTDIKIAYHIH